MRIGCKLFEKVGSDNRESKRASKSGLVFLLAPNILFFTAAMYAAYCKKVRVSFSSFSVGRKRAKCAIIWLVTSCIFVVQWGVGDILSRAGVALLYPVFVPMMMVVTTIRPGACFGQDRDEDRMTAKFFKLFEYFGMFVLIVL